MSETLVLDPKTSAILGVWRSGQVQQDTVRRWAENTDMEGRGRRQTVLQHGYSLQVLCWYFRHTLEPHFRDDSILIDPSEPVKRPMPDWDLLLQACLFHDHGEGELYAAQGHDLALTEHDDGLAALHEDRATCERMRVLDSRIAYEFVFASRLQFAQTGKRLHPDAMPDLVNDYNRHRAIHLTEAHIFEALERYDYLLYAFEHLNTPQVKTRHIAKVIRRHVERLAELTCLIPGFRTEIWTRELEESCRDYIEAYERSLLEGEMLTGR